ncbi:MAG TPA: hypothetical protein PKW21_02505 [Rhabdaerophilum sp.]|nr:hypothetical protein [Rhabdaerophilum sp.]
MSRHAEHCHSIVVPLPPESAFPLFTPAGERLWLAGWQPEFLHPVDGCTEVGMVFRTRHGGEETLWSCIEFAPESHRIRYLRISPATRFVTLSVSCSEEAEGRTRVEVRYAMTALTAEGERMLEALTPLSFAATIDEWQEKITLYVAQRETDTACLSSGA